MFTEQCKRLLTIRCKKVLDIHNEDQEDGDSTQNMKAEDALTGKNGDLTLRIIHENGAPSDKGTTVEIGDMEKEKAEEFEKALWSYVKI